MDGKQNSTVLIGIGANLHDANGAPPLATCRAAIAALARLPGAGPVAVSRWYATEAEPRGQGAPDYVNGVARLDLPPGDPVALLAALRAIEAAAGRTRPYPNAPRTLDLDLIDAWGLVRLAPDPVLPHPRATLRRFVLVPLMDVAPDWRDPVTGHGLDVLLATLPPGAAPRLMKF